jgi:hypothetical protein
MRFNFWLPILAMIAVGFAIVMYLDERNAQCSRTGGHLDYSSIRSAPARCVP